VERPARLLLMQLSLIWCLQPLGLVAQERRNETLFYMRNNEAAYESFRRNIEKLSIIGPQVYAVEGDGVVWGAPPRS
jgi:hypothetical protein